MVLQETHENFLDVTAPFVGPRARPPTLSLILSASFSKRQCFGCAPTAPEKLAAQRVHSRAASFSALSLAS